MQKRFEQIFDKTMPYDCGPATREQIKSVAYELYKAGKSDGETELTNTEFQEKLPEGHWLRNMSREEIARTLLYEADIMHNWQGIFEDIPCGVGVKEFDIAISRSAGEDMTADAPKHDAGKLAWSLFPFDAAEELVRAYEFGAKKYYAHGWRGGFHYSRIFSAVCRHLFAWWRGEDMDEESGLMHLAHAAWGLLCLMDMARKGTGTDDRYKGVTS